MNNKGDILAVSTRQYFQVAIYVTNGTKTSQLLGKKSERCICKIEQATMHGKQFKGKMDPEFIMYNRYLHCSTGIVYYINTAFCNPKN